MILILAIQSKGLLNVDIDHFQCKTNSLSYFETNLKDYENILQNNFHYVYCADYYSIQRVNIRNISY